jgi:hypothetical protein
MSLRHSAWIMYYVMVGWTASIIIVNEALQSMSKYDVLDVFVYAILSDWFEVVSWTIWLACCVWGFIALSLPVRPREPKRAALLLWIWLIVAHIIGHSIYTIMFCKRCHTLFINSLAGNVFRESVETFFQKSSQKAWVQNFLYVITPVANWISAGYVFQFFHQIPPLDILFWCGWNWVIIGFLIGVIPICCFVTTIPIVLGYINAIDKGGNGTESCKPSKIALFYTLDPLDRADIRLGVKNIEDFEYDQSTGDESSSGSSGNRSTPGDEYVLGTNSSSLRSYSSSYISSPSNGSDKGSKKSKPRRPRRAAGIV